MNLTHFQKEQINKLRDYRDEISYSLFHIERVLRDYFPEEYTQAYQHWIPQILTALAHDNRWLDRGVYNMQDTLNKLSDNDQNVKGLTKVIK